MPSGKPAETKKSDNIVVPPTKTTPPSFIDRVLSPLGITITVIIMIVLSCGAYILARKGTIPYIKPAVVMTPTPKITPSPTPIPRPIPHGPMRFSTSQSDKTVPQIREGLIEPYDPEQGSTQSVTVTVRHPQPVTKVSAILKTDHKVSPPVPFTLIEGTNTNGKWKGSWQITDTYLFTYQLILEAAGSASGSAHVEITLR